MIRFTGRVNSQGRQSFKAGVMKVKIASGDGMVEWQLKPNQIGDEFDFGEHEAAVLAKYDESFEAIA